MLVLSRKVDQRIRIGDNIDIVVIAIEGDHVKLGIEAPRQIRVLRNELLEDVQQENLRAAAAALAAPAPLASVLQRFGRTSRHSMADAQPTVAGDDDRT